MEKSNGMDYVNDVLISKKRDNQHDATDFYSRQILEKLQKEKENSLRMATDSLFGNYVELNPTDLKNKEYARLSTFGAVMAPVVTKELEYANIIDKGFTENVVDKLSTSLKLASSIVGLASVVIKSTKSE